jgi:hypothetical protein
MLMQPNRIAQAFASIGTQISKLRVSKLPRRDIGKKEIANKKPGCDSRAFDSKENARANNNPKRDYERFNAPSPD